MSWRWITSSVFSDTRLATVAMASSSASGPPQKPSVPPIDFLSSTVARTYTHVHPALLLSLYVMRFPGLVADPVSNLLQGLPFLAVLQGAYVVTCLPPAGSSSSSASSSSSSLTADGTPTTSSGAFGIGGVVDGDGAKKATSSMGSEPSSGPVLRASKSQPYRRKQTHGSRGVDGMYRRVTVTYPSSSFIHSSSREPAMYFSSLQLKKDYAITELLHPPFQAAILSLSLSLLLGTPILAIVMVLFGAPFTTHHAQTALCAAHLAILSSTGLVYVHGVDNSVWREIWAFARPADAVWGGAFGTGVGAWLGAIPIPLDW
jgi:GPI ethanolamine phosphate transferase 2/3 subunit F